MSNSTLEDRLVARNSASRVPERSAITLRDLVANVFSDESKMPVDIVSAVAEPNWSVMLRTATEMPVQAPNAAPSPRKYLWVRRTSRRAYNAHMHKMRDTLDDMKAMPAVVIFGSVVGIALLLSVVVR